MTCGLPSGSAKPMTVCPVRNTDGSAGVARTCRTISELLKSSGRETSVAPCDRYPSSGNRASVPAPDSTATSSPDLTSPETAAGMTATRVSPGHVSLGMPTLIGQECSRSYFLSQSPIVLTTAGEIVLSGRELYSDTSPVLAGTSRWLIP